MRGRPYDLAQLAVFDRPVPVNHSLQASDTGTGLAGLQERLGLVEQRLGDRAHEIDRIVLSIACHDLIIAGDLSVDFAVGQVLGRIFRDVARLMPLWIKASAATARTPGSASSV